MTILIDGRYQMIYLLARIIEKNAVNQFKQDFSHSPWALRHAENGKS